jgi:hypothetical protein
MRMSQLSDVWLTPVQAVYFLATGDNLIDVVNRSDEVLIGSLARIPSSSVDLLAEAGPDERDVALKKLKEQLALSRKMPAVDLNKLLDTLLKTGLVAAQGRRTLSTPYETINPVEFSDLKLAGMRAEDASGNVVYIKMQLSGSDLMRAQQELRAPYYIARQAALAPDERVVPPETGAPDSQPPSATPGPVAPAAAMKRRRGPAKNSIDRYGEADRALYQELNRIAREDHVSLTAAALELANGKIENKVILGHGAPLSRAKRLVARYYADHPEPS